MNKNIKKLGLFLIALLCLVVVAGCNEKGGNDDQKYTSETYNWVTPQTDALELKQEFIGKDFEKDGIGLVKEVVRFTDGDTATFRLESGKEVTVRYNGINTPESTYRIEAWGNAASACNKELIKSALAKGAKIVLQAENLSERFDSTGKRYLAWVWVVFPDNSSRLINLELAELGYAHVKSASGTQYEEYFTKAIYDISKYRLRIYGEVDPKYDYSTDAKEMTIKEIREIYGTAEAIDYATGVNGDSEFVSPLIKVSGVVVKKNGDANAYIQQYDSENDQYYGIYVYGGYNSITKLIEGCTVQVTGKINYYYGSVQITDVKTNDQIKIYSAPDLDQIYVTEEIVDDIDDIYAYSKIGSLVTLHNLTVYDYNDAKETSAITLKCHYVDENGQQKQFNIRISQETKLVDPEDPNGKVQIRTGAYFVGKTFESITGIVSYYNGGEKTPYSNGHIQLALTSMNDVVFAK